MLEAMIPLLDNASCSVLLFFVLWRFDNTVRYIADMQKEVTEELVRSLDKTTAKEI